MHFTSVLLPAPFSPSSAWNDAGRRTFERDVVERREGAEALGHVQASMASACLTPMAARDQLVVWDGAMVR